MVYKTKIILNIRRLKNFPIESPGIFIAHIKNSLSYYLSSTGTKRILAIKKGLVKTLKNQPPEPYLITESGILPDPPSARPGEGTMGLPLLS
jgi:hypothetical protein